MPTIYKWRSRVVTGHKDLALRDKPGRKCNELHILRISQILEDDPFCSVCTIAENIEEMTTIVYNHLVNHLHLMYKDQSGFSIRSLHLKN